MGGRVEAESSMMVWDEEAAAFQAFTSFLGGFLSVVVVYLSCLFLTGNGQQETLLVFPSCLMEKMGRQVRS